MTGYVVGRFHSGGVAGLRPNEVAAILKPPRSVRPELVERRIGDCGCPEEQWLFDTLDLIIHFEPNGDVDAHLDGGDWGEADFGVKNCPDEEEGRQRVFLWALRLTEGPVT